MFFRNCIFFLVISNMQLRSESMAETLDDVLDDCRDHIRRRVLCFGFTEEKGVIVAKSSCALRYSQCNMWLRVKIAQSKGEWNPTLKLTCAIVHSREYIGKEYEGAIAFALKNSQNLSLIVGQKYSPGHGKAIAVTSFGGWTSDDEIWTDATSLVFSFYMHAIIRISGQERYTFSMFERVHLYHAAKLPAGGTPAKRFARLPEEALKSIVNFSGFKYVGCGQNNILCLSLTRTVEETQNCIKWSNCSEFVRLASTSDNWTLVYVNRELSTASTGYISVGFSTERSMGRALVFDCIKEKSTIRGQISYNEGHQNLAFPLFIDSNQIISHNYFECFWNISSTATVGTERFAVDLGTRAYHIVRAFGHLTSKTTGEGEGAYGKLKHIAVAVTKKKIRVTPGRIEEVSDAKDIDTGYYSALWLIAVWGLVLCTSTGLWCFLYIEQRKRFQKLRKKSGRTGASDLGEEN